MKIKSAELDIVVGVTSKLPETSLPELAFAGRSNVGKSSLINSLTCRKKLARISENPGKTQTINYYKINSEFYFVDLPGYGFAKVPLEVKAKWGKMIENYLKKSRNLKAVIQLVDIRHEPKSSDVDMHDWIKESGFEPIIIATKSDKIKPSQIEEHLNVIKSGLGVMDDTPVIPFSSLTKSGLEEVYSVIGQVLDNNYLQS